MLGNLLFFYLLYVYIPYFINLFRKEKREIMIKNNSVLNKYRKKSFKSINEQKEFLKIKYPYTETKFNLKNILYFIYNTIKFIAILILYFKLINYFNINISLTIGILCWIIIPFLVSYIASKYNLENNDFYHLLKFK